MMVEVVIKVVEVMMVEVMTVVVEVMVVEVEMMVEVMVMMMVEKELANGISKSKSAKPNIER